MMNTFFAIALSVSLLISTCAAQYEVFKGRQGVSVLLSKKENQAFTLEIGGDKQIVPIGMDSAPHPYFRVDGRFLQVMPVPNDEFKGQERAGDEILLKQHLQYEADFFKQTVHAMHAEVRKLPSGRIALFWSFVPTQTEKEQVFMSFRAKGYILVLGSAVDGSDTKAAVQKFLIHIATTFRSYDHPVTLKFFPDGRFEPK